MTTAGARALLDDVPVDDADVDVQKEVAEQLQRQAEGSQFVEILASSEHHEDKHGICTCQEYLREGHERVREQWDCESIISTYSTLDNHPAVIKDKSSSAYKPYKSRFAKTAEAEAAISANGTNAFIQQGESIIQHITL